MKKLYSVLAIFMLVFVSSCTQRGCQNFNKSAQFTTREYEIIMYSGGDTVFKDKFRGIINQEQNTDGFFYIKNDTLIEVSGDYTLKSID